MASPCSSKKEQGHSSDLGDFKLSCEIKSKKRREKRLSKDERILQQQRKLTEERWIIKHEKIKKEEEKMQNRNKESKRLNDIELQKSKLKARKNQEKLDFEEQQRLVEDEEAEKRIVLKEQLRNEKIKQLEENWHLRERERKQIEMIESKERTVETVKKQPLAQENVGTKRQLKNRLRKNKKNQKNKAEEEKRKQMEMKEEETLDSEMEEDDMFIEYTFDYSKSRTIWFLNKHSQERIRTEILGLPCPPWPGVTSGWDQTLVDDGLSALEHFFIKKKVYGNDILPSYVKVNIWVLHCIMILEKRLHFINKTRWNYHRTELLVKWFTSLNRDILILITDDMDKHGVFNSRESAFYNWIKTCTIPGGIYLFYVITEFQSGQNEGLEVWENQPTSNLYHLKYKTFRHSKHISNKMLSL